MKTLVIALFVLLLAAPARADFDWTTTTAVIAWSRGQDAYDRGDYEEAIRQFEVMLTVFPTAAEIIYDVALAHYRLDNVYASRRYLRVYMQIPGSRQYTARVNKLANALVAAIDDDYDAQGLRFACDFKNRRCGIAHWPFSIVRAWQLAEEGK